MAGVDPTGMPEARTKLFELMAKQDITDLLHRYCRGVDRLDMELVRSCYHPDATDSHGTFHGSVEEYLEWSERLLRRYTATLHTLSNILIEIGPIAGTGEAPVRWARSEAYGVAYHRTGGGEPELNLTVGFRFIDDLSSRDGGPWLIQRRVATTEWVHEQQYRPVDPRFRQGRRDRSDPLYSDRPDQ
ncbi:nuclear transport factor 2 family protein [Candidatus Poriferisocius sp.]|uniref:nuclear transport factor 2 family protein n=1 Tax=Candidatus Poriferisocius sp. TaxID=3101276 RepID=UPI003B01E878